MSDILHRAPWGFFAIRQGEFTCCHGTTEAGHSVGCPYDKNLGPLDLSNVSAQRGINFHDSTMALRHGPESQFAKNYVPQSTRPESGGRAVGKGDRASSSVVKSPRVVSGDLFADDLT